MIDCCTPRFNQLGVSFDKGRLVRQPQIYEHHEATPTDVAHLERYWGELDPELRNRISSMIGSSGNDWNLNEWAADILLRRLSPVK